MPSSHQVTWEAEYFDGRTIRERDGVLYKHIDRDQMKVFRLVTAGEIIMEFRVKAGQNGNGLAYRRRTTLGSAGRQTWFVVGMIPNGPVVSYQPETNQVLKADRFETGSGPLGRMVPFDFESWTNTSHTTDTLVRRQNVTLPSGYVLTV